MTGATRSASAGDLTLAEIANRTDGTVQGQPGLRVCGVAPVRDAGPDQLGLLAARRYLRFVEESNAGALLVSADLADSVPSDRSCVIVQNPHHSLPRLLEYFHPPSDRKPGIHPTAVLGSDVRLGERAQIGPYAVVEDRAWLGDDVTIGSHSCVGADVRLGDRTVLHPHVVLYPGVTVGADAVLHAGVRLGVDGFGYVTVDGENRKVPQVGGCIIEDHVEIGANACVDRGSIGDTKIGAGTKLDNLVHIAHNVQLGELCLFAAGVGIAGSTRMGKGVVFGGHAGAIDHLEIGDGAMAAAKAAVTQDVKPGEIVMGNPARPRREFLRAHGAVYRLADLVKRLRKLERDGVGE
jgi:UDP-3-O-[3-hydroxymyristoyl] glucosamine N-acyltransferase